MSNAGTLWAGYGVTIVAVLGYVIWLLRRASKLGTSLDIGSQQSNGQSHRQDAPARDQDSAARDADRVAPPAQARQNG